MAAGERTRHGEDGSPGGDDTLHEHFTGLFSRHHAALMSYTLSLAPNWSDAEDILQQASVIMWPKFGTFTLGTDFLRWSCQIVRFHAMNHLRKRTRDRHVFSTAVVESLAGEGLDDAARLDAERKALEWCLQKLDAGHRRLLDHCYQPGATIKHVAGVLGRTPNSVYKGLNRIRQALLRCIQQTLAKEGA